MDPTRSEALRRMLAGCLVAAGALASLGAARTLTAGPPAVAAVEIDVGAVRRAALATYLAERYDRDAEGVRAIVDEAHGAAAAADLDPLLVLAVIAVESRFDPRARSDYGATGLMQVVPRFHREKLAPHGGEAALSDPRVNTRVGTQILKEYLRRSGSLRAGLQRYAGWDDDEQRYARKVLGEKERLRRVATAAQKRVEPSEDA